MKSYHKVLVPIYWQGWKGTSSFLHQFGKYYALISFHTSRIKGNIERKCNSNKGTVQLTAATIRELYLYFGKFHANTSIRNKQNMVIVPLIISRNEGNRPVKQNKGFGPSIISMYLWNITLKRGIIRDSCLFSDTFRKVDC